MSQTSGRALRTKARSALLGNYGTAFGAMVLYSMIVLLLSFLAESFSGPPRRGTLNVMMTLTSSFLVVIVATLLQTGLSFMALNIARTGQGNLRDLFLGFRYHTARLTGLTLILTAIEYVCLAPMMFLSFSLLLYGTDLNPSGHRLSAGAFAALCILCLLLTLGLFIGFFLLYSQSLFLFIDHQDYGIGACLSESARLMMKNRLRLFRLYLAFIGYGCLVLLSFGIASVWVTPYLYVTEAEFYIELTGNRQPYGV